MSTARVVRRALLAAIFVALLVGLIVALTRREARPPTQSPAAARDAVHAGPTPASQLFPAADLMRVGVYYYPEQVPEEQWDRDFAKMRAMGFEFVHMAEFSWAFLEPEDGRFDFAWLDRAVALAARQGLRVILCTPTPTPPAWLAAAHPDIYLVGEDGRRREHGARGKNALANPTFRRHAGRIVTELGRHYASNPAVWGWQIDNEPEAPPDYSPSAQAAFRTWLKKRHGTVDVLNREWGAAFWSLRYRSFDEVRSPNPSMQYGVNPHAVLDFRRFTADQTAAYLDWQADLLRRNTGRSQWITTNYIANISSADARRTRALDFSAFTLYPVSGAPNLGEQGFRIGAQHGMIWGAAFHRAIGGVTGVMELQPGQVNWGRVNPQPLPGVVRMWLWHAFAEGAAFASPYQFRQSRFGSELYHYGIVGPDGVTPSPGGLEYSQVAREMRELRALRNANAAAPSALRARRAGLLWSHENLWDIEHHRETTLWNTWEHVLRYMGAARSLGAPVDVVFEATDLSSYPVLIAPAYQLVDAALVRSWTNYVERGGHLVLTCRTGQKQRNGQLWEAPWAALIYPLIGARLPFFDTLPGEAKAHVAMGTSRHEWNTWGDVLEPAPGTDVLAAYADQYYAGKAAVTHRTLGKGTVTYVGVHTKDGQLERAVLREVYRRAGIATEDYPEGVYVGWRDGFWVAVNYSSEPYAVPLPAEASVLYGHQPLAPADVLVWTDAAATAPAPAPSPPGAAP